MTNIVVEFCIDRENEEEDCVLVDGDDVPVDHWSVAACILGLPHVHGHLCDYSDYKRISR